MLVSLSLWCVVDNLGNPHNISKMKAENRAARGHFSMGNLDWGRQKLAKKLSTVLSTKVEDRHWVGIMCVVCDGDTGLHSDALICATAQLAADLLNYTDNIISRGQCRCWARRGKKLSGTPAGPVPVPFT